MSVSFGEDCPIDTVVWYELPASCKSVWWPSKVVSTSEDSIQVETFGDRHPYTVKDTERVKLFNCPNPTNLLAVGRKKFRHRKKNLASYREAVEEGTDFYRTQQDDPTFTIDFDCDISGLSKSCSRSVNFDDSMFTPGSCTTDDNQTPSSVGRRSATKRKRKQNNFGYDSDVPDDGLIPPINDSSSSTTRVEQKKRQKIKDDNPDNSLRQKQNGSSSKGSKTTDSKTVTREHGSEHTTRRLIYDDDVDTHADPLAPTSMETCPIHSPRQPKRSRRSPDAKSAVMVKQNPDKQKPKSETWNKQTTESESGPDSDDRMNETDSLTRNRDVSTVTSTCLSSIGKSASPVVSRPPIDAARGTGSEQPSSPSPQDSADIGLGDASFMPVSKGFRSIVDEILEMSSEEDDEDSEESEEDMPAFDFSVNENVKLHELEANDIVWVKHQKSPYWPALVIRKQVRKKKKKPSAIYVKFFGHTDQSDLKITNCKNVALFGTEKAKQFKEVGDKDKNRKSFIQAVEEVEKLMCLRGEGEISGTPDEQYKQIVKKRPKSYVAGESPMSTAYHMRAQEMIVESAKERMSPTDLRNPSSSTNVGSDSDESVSDIPSSEGEEENDDYEYNYAKVMEIIDTLKTYMIEIANGNTSSRRHKIFTSGTEKDRNNLKRDGTFGPLMKWTGGKRVEFVSKVTSIAKRDGPLKVKLTQDYLLGVLVPEVLIKVMMTVEGLSYELAEQKL